MNIKANSKERKWMDVGHGLFICIYKCIQWCVCVFLYAFIFIALTLVPQSASTMPASLLLDVTMPGGSLWGNSNNNNFWSELHQFPFFFFLIRCRSSSKAMPLQWYATFSFPDTAEPQQAPLDRAATVFLCRNHHLLAAAWWNAAPEICISSSSVPNARHNYLRSLYHALDPVLQH